MHYEITTHTARVQSVLQFQISSDISISTHVSSKSACDNIIINNKIYLFFQIEFEYLAQKTVFGTDSVLQALQ